MKKILLLLVVPCILLSNCTRTVKVDANHSDYKNENHKAHHINVHHTSTDDNKIKQNNNSVTKNTANSSKEINNKLSSSDTSNKTAHIHTHCFVESDGKKHCITLKHEV